MRVLIRLVLVALIGITSGQPTYAAPTTKHFANRDDVSQFVTQMAEQYGFNESELLALFAHTPAMPKTKPIISRVVKIIA